MSGQTLLKLLGTGAAAAALVGAFLIDSVPKGVRLSAPDHAAAASAIRVVLLVIALAIVLFAMWKGSGLWVDTLILTAAALIGIAVVKAYIDARPANPDTPAPAVVFDVPFGLVNASHLPPRSRQKQSDVVLVVVHREQGASGGVTVASHRYDARLVAAYPTARQARCRSRSSAAATTATRSTSRPTCSSSSGSTSSRSPASAAPRAPDRRS